MKNGKVPAPSIVEGVSVLYMGLPLEIAVRI
jgi:hypothetical protein